MTTHTVPATKTSGLAIASLVLGCISIILGPLTGIPAIFTGHIAHSRINREPSLTGGGLAIAGFVLGYIFSILLSFVFVIFILSAATAFSAGVTSSAQTTAASAKMHEISAKLETHRMISGSYPTTTQGIDALVSKPTDPPLPKRWKQQFKALPLDPWGNAYFYTYHPGTDTYSLASSGPDGTISTSDDVTLAP